MSLAPLSAAPPPDAQDRRDGFATARARTLPTARRIARRHFMIVATKFLLPVAALALLATIVLWPEFARWAQEVHMHGLSGLGVSATGVLTDARYNGVDERGRPYTVTATRARQVTAQQVDLVQPKGDVSLQGGHWLYAQSRDGTYTQHVGSLDLYGDVDLYRDDGTTMQTDAATVDLKVGAASSSDLVHAEGPFGTLDAQGFFLSDRGTQIQFTGPGRLILNAARK